LTSSSNPTKSEKTNQDQLGQFATPRELALDIMRYAKDLVRASESIRFLEPGFGEGAFYSALLDVFPRVRIDRAWGYEIDPRYRDIVDKLWGQTPLEFEINDFVELLPPESDEEKANLIVCNPPYVRHQHLSVEEKKRLHSLVRERTGIELNGMAGLYCYFLLLSHHWLVDRGVAGWLMPSEFMDVNYGLPIRQYLTQQVRLLHIHRFAPDEVQFPNALVTSSVVWFSKEIPSPDHVVTFGFGGTLLRPESKIRVPLHELRQSNKWTRFSDRALDQLSLSVNTSSLSVRLSDVFTIKRGLATGANKFFILTPEQIEQRNLPLEFFRPILPSPRHLQTEVIEGDDDGMPRVEQRLLLLDCELSEEQVRANYPSLWTYLEIGKEQKIHKRYLCSHRSPWYSQEKRSPPPILCTYMGRHNRERQSTPFRFILNDSEAVATNAYLLLYPKPRLERAIENDDHLLRTIWEILARIPFASLRAQGRVYGGALYKLEPNELANVPANELLAEVPREVFSNAD
jgi:adenine-specific DNA-methyltransferase